MQSLDDMRTDFKRAIYNLLVMNGSFCFYHLRVYSHSADIIVHIMAVRRPLAVGSLPIRYIGGGINHNLCRVILHFFRQ